MSYQKSPLDILEVADANFRAAKIQADDLVRERGQGRKDDAAKPRFGLLPWDVVSCVVRVLTLGAVKYADDNWKRVPNARSRYFDAAMRHLTAWWEGELHDPETKEPHLAHAICCLVFLLWFDLNATIVKEPDAR